jgi:hypothetical protein
VTIGTFYLAGRTLAGNITEPGQRIGLAPTRLRPAVYACSGAARNATVGARSSRRSAAKLANCCLGDGCHLSHTTHIAVGSSKRIRLRRRQ